MNIADSMQAQAKAVADPSRFKLFRFIADATEPVGVAELTELLGFNHNAIRQHLAVLVDEKLITESNEDRKVRGRPRKQYEVRSDALSAFGSVSGSYQRLAELLLEMSASGETPFEVGYRAGRADAVGAHSDQDEVVRLLRQLAIGGFEPSGDATTGIILNHCPFADIASKNQSIVCELHRGLISGELSTGEDHIVASLEPRDPAKAGCVVTIEVRTKLGEDKKSNVRESKANPRHTDVEQN